MNTTHNHQRSLQVFTDSSYRSMIIIHVKYSKLISVITVCNHKSMSKNLEKMVTTYKFLRFYEDAVTRFVPGEISERKICNVTLIKLNLRFKRFMTRKLNWKYIINISSKNTPWGYFDR